MLTPKNRSPHPSENPIPGTLNIILLLAGSSALAALLYFASRYASIPVYIGAALLFAPINGMIFSLLHEATHSTFHKNRTINALGGIVAAAFFPTSYTLQKITHVGHHDRNRTPVERFDLYGPDENVFLKRVQWYGVLFGIYWMLAPLSCLAILIWPGILRRKFLRNPDSSFAQQTSADAMIAPLLGPPLKWIRLQAALVLLFQAGLFFLLDLDLRVWLVSYAAFGFAWSSLQYATHSWSPLDIRTGAWNLRVFPPVRWMALNYHHHLAHHLHPHVPWPYLGRYVDRNSPRPTFFQVYKSMWRGPRPLEEGPSLHERIVTAAKRSEALWRNAAPLLFIAGSFFSLFYGIFLTTDTLSSLFPQRLDLALPLEAKIPFVPWMSVPYLSLNLLFVLAVFYYRNWRTLLPIALTLSAQLLLAVPFFLFLPLKNGFHHSVPDNLSGFLFRLADGANLTHNDFPSLHVAFSVSLGWIISVKTDRIGKAFLLLWVTAITLSTVLIHAHHLIDIVGGLALAYWGVSFFYFHFKSDRYFEKLEIDFACLSEMIRLTRRHIRYLSVFAVLYVSSLFRWERRRVLRAGFCLVQHIDDLFDGDIPAEDPERYVDALIRNENSDGGAPEGIRKLVPFLMRELEEKSNEGEDLRELFYELVEVMRFDFLRRSRKILLSERELVLHHNKTFSLSVDLTLALFGSSLKVREIPEMAEALSWVSPVRDLHEDLEKGLCNIPLEVLRSERSGKPLRTERDGSVQWADPWPGSALLKNDSAIRWLRREYLRSGELLESLRLRIATLPPGGARPYLTLFYRAILLFHRSNKHWYNETREMVDATEGGVIPWAS